jgi:hypothetical protein
MKTTVSKEALPSPLRLLIYLALIAVFCALNYLAIDAKIDSSALVGKAENEVRY